MLLLEYLQMQLQSGHTERAVACIQALLEFNCFSPEFPGVSHPWMSLFHSPHHELQCMRPEASYMATVLGPKDLNQVSLRRRHLQ